MNIFKILASGDGSINEPNVSAFLGYLLDPKSDHGISDVLLKEVLNAHYINNKQSSLKDFLVDKHGNIRNLSIRSNFNIEVLLEQAFKSDKIDKREIVDIVILCFEKANEKKESLASSILSNNNIGTLRQIFLIENKIKDNSSREEQLVNQAKSTIDTLTKILNKTEEEIKKIVSLIFISPDGEKSNLQYQQLTEDISLSIPQTHIHWDSENDQEPTIVSYIRKMISDESKGDIEAINEYTKHTIKSFISFIQNDFRSTIEEELENKTVRDIEYNFEEFKSKHFEKFNDNSKLLLTGVDELLKLNYKNINIRYSPTHPISVFIKGQSENKIGKKIFSLSKYGNDLKILFINKNQEDNIEQKAALNEYLEKFNLEITNTESWGYEIKLSKISSQEIMDIFKIQYELSLK